ncbi:SMP-30/gluconolactonase/LRE family protein [Agromyces bauzanensis]
MSAHIIASKNLIFPESPRWHAGKLWLTDIFGRRLVTVTLEGELDVVWEFEDRPSGLGFLPDGTPLVGLVDSNRVVRVSGGVLVTHSDVGAATDARLNDMVVDADGTAYVGCALDRTGRDPSADLGDVILRVEPSGESTVVRRGGIIRPNGLALTPTGTLSVAEFSGARVSRWRRSPSGQFDALDSIIEMPGALPDGLCVDADGGTWVANLKAGRFLYFNATGRPSRSVTPSGRWAVACTLGGADRRTLFLTSLNPPEPGDDNTVDFAQCEGFVEALPVESAGVGLP